jgi:subtilisin family serine protease
MMKSHKPIQLILGSILAMGLIISPLQNPSVVFSAWLEEDTPPPQEVIPGVGGIDPVSNPPVDEPSGSQVEPVTNPSVEESPVPQSEPVETSSPPSDESDIPPGDQISTPQPDAPAITEDNPKDIILEATPDLANTSEPQVVMETTAQESPQPLPESQVSGQPTLQELAVVVHDPVSTGLNDHQLTTSPSWTDGQVIVRFNASISMDEQITRLANLGLAISGVEPTLGVLVVNVRQGTEQETIKSLSGLDGIQYTEPLYLASALDVTPNDPGFINQGDMEAINAPGGWEYFTGSSNVIIAIIDTGVNLNQPDLAGKVLPGFNFILGNENSADDNGHGTHVAGIAAAVGNNATGIAGLDWKAKILPVKVLDSQGFGSAWTVSQGIIFAVDHGAKIINLSLGFSTTPSIVADAVEYAYQHGVTVVAATGNSNSAVAFPANLPHVIAVGAVDNTGTRWASSNYGPEIDLVAPGVNVYSTNPIGYGTRTGTSMAAPHVAGLAALLEGIHPLTPVQVESFMYSTSRDLGTPGWDAYFGNGLIQVKDAILKLLNALFPVHREEPQDENPPSIPMPTRTPTFTPTPTPVN